MPPTWETVHNVIRSRFKAQIMDAAPGGSIVAKTTVSASSTDNSFNDGTEDLSVFTAGQYILVSGFTEATNNGYFTVVSATANKLVVSGATLTTEAAGDTVSILSALPTQYDNDGAMVKPEGARWCRFSIRPGETLQVETGGTSRYRTSGVAIAQIFEQIGQGDKDHLVIADAIKTAFRAVSASGVRFQTPYHEVIGRQGDEWQVNVVIPFYVDEVI
jgi:hypothetical protein